MLFVVQGRMTLLLGPPGAGKTTLLRSLAGQMADNKAVQFTGEEDLAWRRLDVDLPAATGATAKRQAAAPACLFPILAHVLNRGWLAVHTCAWWTVQVTSRTTACARARILWWAARRRTWTRLTRTCPR